MSMSDGSLCIGNGIFRANVQAAEAERTACPVPNGMPVRHHDCFQRTLCRALAAPHTLVTDSEILCAACPLICFFHHQEHRCGPFTLNPDALLFQNVSYDAAKQFVRFIKRRLHILLIGKIKVRHPVIHGLQQEVRVLLSAGVFLRRIFASSAATFP